MDFQEVDPPIITGDPKKFLELNNQVEDLFSLVKAANTIILVKPVQSGKTSEILKIVEHTYKYSVTIFLSDKNSALAGQTNKRTLGLGWKVQDFRDVNSPREAMKFLKDGVGKRKLAHFLMEVNNIDTLMMLLELINDPVTLVIDEGDKNKNVSSEVETDDDGEDVLEMPPITRGIIACKNILADRNDGSKTIYVTATPQGLLVSEKDENRLVIIKEPFNNWVGVAYNHKANFEMAQAIRHCSCKTRDRWTGNQDDYDYNTYRQGVQVAIDRFEKMTTKDESIKQIMLISLENRNASQARLAHFVRRNISAEMTNNIEIIVFNGENKSKEYPLLSDRIRECATNKIIVVAGFMASRGVSFTDFSDKDNRYELVCQVHAAKKTDPLNSALQAMRIFGPARRTVVRPLLVCNQITYRDCTENFEEGYRICKELAEGKRVIHQGRYDSERPLTQKYNFRYMRQGHSGILLFESHDDRDHEPITEM